jgi:hypothetical protein
MRVAGERLARVAKEDRPEALRLREPMETFYFLCRYEGREWCKVEAFDEYDAERAAEKYAEAEWKRDKNSSPIKKDHDTAKVWVKHPQDEAEVLVREFEVSLQFIWPSFFADEVGFPEVFILEDFQ